jgi:tetratricopeptide (TPR) repeat protein
MKEGHYDDNALLSFMEGDAELVDIAKAQSHLSDCSACSRRLVELKHWEIILSDPETWTESALKRASRDDGPTVASIGGLARRLNTEARRAREILARLPADVRIWRNVLRHAEATEGLARALIQLAHKSLTTAPERALAVLDEAEDVLRRVDGPTALLEGDLWKERSNAERLRGEYETALGHLEKADRCYPPSAAYDRAFVHWGRGSVYFEMKRFADARTSLEKALSIFGEYREELCAAQVQVTLGGVYFEEGDISAARERFAASEPLVAAFGDEETLARIFLNLATCDIRLGNAATAREYAEKAAALFEALDMESEAARLLWSLGEALTALGRPHGALAYVKDAAERFERLGMVGEAISARCDTLALLLATGKADEAARIAASAVAFFTRVGADVDAAHALDYLRRAALAMRATPDLVAHVRQFVAARLRGEAGEFEPLTFEDVN